jgi:hypothetical protein
MDPFSPRPPTWCPGLRLFESTSWLLDRDIMPYMRTRDSALRKKNPGYGPERFTYQPESNSYRCPAGESLNYVGLNVRNRAYAYIGSAKRCGACSLKAQCTRGRYKYLAIHIHESARQRARELANTPEFSTAQRQRKKVEALFAELKNQIGLRRPALATDEVRARAVLSSSGCAEHQATGTLPQPANSTAGCHCLEMKRELGIIHTRVHKDRSIAEFFNTHPWLQQLTSGLSVIR